MAHILIAEDDDSMLNFLKMALERAGHSIVAKKNGLDALAAFDTAEPFDILVTDIVMPGLDGIELAERVEKKSPETKIIFMTGFAAMTVNQKKGLKENTDTKLMSKPFHLNDLVNHIDEILNKNKEDA